MEWQILLLLFFGSAVILLLSGIPVGLTFITVSVGAALLLWNGWAGLGQISLNFISSVKSWSLLPIALFILMGELLFQSGVASRAIDIVDLWLGRVPGRLSILAVVSSTLMGTFTGSSLASGSMLATALYPEMTERGYHPVMTIGPIAGCAGLAMMIPPSSLAVFLASIAGVSVGKLLIGGIIPGLIMGALYISYIVIRAVVQPSVAPPYQVPKRPLKEKLIVTLKDLVPLTLIILSVSGVILLGIATPSEAAATGVVASLIITLCYRCMTWEKLKAALKNTLRTSAMLLTIMLGSAAFSQILSFSGATRGITTWVTSLTLPPLAIIACLLGLIFFLGCFVETNSIILITIPIFMPIVKALGFDPVWFCLMFMMQCELAESTPPFGVQLFMMKGLFPSLPMKTIIDAGWPYILTDLLAVTIVLFFPAVALWLPSIIK